MELNQDCGSNEPIPIILKNTFQGISKNCGECAVFVLDFRRFGHLTNNPYAN